MKPFFLAKTICCNSGNLYLAKTICRNSENLYLAKTICRNSETFVLQTTSLLYLVPGYMGPFRELGGGGLFNPLT